MKSSSVYIDKIRKHLPKETYRDLRIKSENISEEKVNKIKDLFKGKINTK